MKLLVFAHTPPPHHGQSSMVQWMLDGFGGDQRKTAPARAAPPSAHGISCYHVNARLSRDNEDIGGFRPAKLFLLLGYCLQAVWCRFRYGVTTLYYVPAPGKLSAVMRDWVVMLVCRPFYPRLILHWHAAGLAQWLETTASRPTRALTHFLLRRADLSILNADFNRADGEGFQAKKIAVVKNCIPDPCPNFDSAILPRREARVAARRQLLAGQALSAGEWAGAGDHPKIVRVLFLAHCMREKGFFDAIDGVLLANEQLCAGGSPVRMYLTLAGSFHSEAERAEFQKRMEPSDIKETVRWLGFVSGEQKLQCLAQADLLCFPTYYSAETQALTVIEAMAFGLPIVTTKWRSIPDMLPPGYAALVAPKSPQEVAQALRGLLAENLSRALRAHFLRHFTLEEHLRGLAAALRGLEKS